MTADPCPSLRSLRARCFRGLSPGRRPTSHHRAPRAPTGEETPGRMQPRPERSTGMMQWPICCTRCEDGRSRTEPLRALTRGRARMRCQWPGKGARPTTPPHALHLPHPHIEAIHTACHSVQPGRGCPHTSRGSSGERRTQQGDRSFFLILTSCVLSVAPTCSSTRVRRDFTAKFSREDTRNGQTHRAQPRAPTALTTHTRSGSAGA